MAKAIRAHSGAGLGTSIGLVRNRNEDCCLVARASYGIAGRSNFTIALVCDGLGGMSHGQEAAILAASTFTAHLFCASTTDWQKRLAQAIAHVNAQVYHLLGGDGGTTLSAVLSFQGGAMFCHVGDSRIYGITSDRNVEQLSRDDTINALLKRQAIDGQVPKDSRLLQFVGMGGEMEAQIAAVPSHFRSVLLTSDGAHDIPYSMFQRVVSAASGGSDLIRKLIALSDMTGGRDNASAVMLPLGPESERYDEVIGCELLAIMPNETLAIHIPEAGTWEQSGDIRNTMLDYPLGEASKWIEKTSSLKRDVGIVMESNLTETKGRKLTAKVRKSKRPPTRLKDDVADHLPLDKPSNEVDVQFSVLVTPPDENKK